MQVVPREAFMSDELGELAYEDAPLPIEEGQTISQPYIVALKARLAWMREARIWPSGLRYLWTDAFGFVLPVSLNATACGPPHRGGSVGAWQPALAPPAAHTRGGFELAPFLRQQAGLFGFLRA